MAKFQLVILLVTISWAAAVPCNLEAENVEVDNVEVDNVEVDNVELTEDLAMEYLNTYGYVKADAMETFEEVLGKFQDKMGLEVTGELDEATNALMNTPRCGMPDYKDGDLSAPYTIEGVKWSKSALTYSVEQYPSKGSLSKATLYSVLQQALDKWAAVTPLSFTRATSNGDIRVYFVGSRDHKCGYAFNPYTLAHAYYPITNTARRCDFNNYDYTFTHASSSNYNLDWIATHELGHNLGMGHSDPIDSVMFPYYIDRDFSYCNPISLSADDIAGVRSMYP